MARTILTVILIVSVQMFIVGCEGPNSGQGKVVPQGEKNLLAPVPVVQNQTSAETDIVEQVVTNREAYRRTLKSLVDYYTNTGNDMKLAWAEKELRSLDKTRQYHYIIEASVAGPNLKPTASIEMANYIYEDAVRREKLAKRFIIIIDDDQLRVALGKYNEVIKRYPTSDKIDGCAFRAAGIYEYFKDYTIALLYYQRTWEWNPQTPYLAEFKAACILDLQLSRRGEALELYQKAVKKGGLTEDEKKFVEERIAILSKSGQGK
jgi:tetratricopeptide (TPR) repeat protein